MSKETPEQRQAIEQVSVSRREEQQYGNAILSRHRILFTVAKTLPFVTEEPFEGFEIPLRRKVMMSRIKIPGLGNINVYNTHLCAFCDPNERWAQAQVLFQFKLQPEFFRKSLLCKD